MQQTSYNKDKNIKIFQIIKERTLEGFTVIKKKYIHPINKYLKAYIRDLSSKEIQTNKQAQDESTMQIIINRREITKDMYVEYRRRGFKNIQTYEINGIDYFTDSTNEIKLNVSLIKQELTFDEEEGTEWQQ